MVKMSQDLLRFPDAKRWLGRYIPVYTAFTTYSASNYFTDALVVSHAAAESFEAAVTDLSIPG
jgi:hypothetical protein